MSYMYAKRWLRSGNRTKVCACVGSSRWGEDREVSPSPTMYGGDLPSLKKYFCYLFDSKTDHLSWAYISCTAGGILWNVSTLIRWRHLDIRLLSTRGHRQSTETCCWLCRCRRWLDAFRLTSAQCIQDGSTVVRFSPSTKSATFRSIGCWLWSRVACQMHARSRYFHWRWPDDVYPSQSDMLEVFCCPSTTMKHMPICQMTWCSRSSWRWCFPGLTTPLQLLPAFQSNSWTGFNLCRTPPLHGWSSKLVVRTVGPLLRRVHWLRMPERILFRLAVLLYHCLHGSAPGYLASDLQHVSHLNARRPLRSLSTSSLVAPRTVRSIIGDCTFPATAVSVWSSLPETVRSSPSLQVFRCRLKTKLFACSYRHD